MIRSSKPSQNKIYWLKGRVDANFMEEVEAFIESNKKLELDKASIVRRAVRDFMDSHPVSSEKDLKVAAQKHLRRAREKAAESSRPKPHSTRE